MVSRKFFLCFYLILISNPLLAAVIEGNSNGDITLVEFFDYQCPHCRNMSATVNELIKQNRNLRVVYRVLPILDDTAWFEASAALAARNQRKFKSFHNLLIHQTETPTLSDVLSLAKQVELNINQLRQDMSNPKISHELNENLSTAKRMNINTIPTFLIGRTADSYPKFRFDGEVSYAVLQNAILQSDQ